MKKVLFVLLFVLSGLGTFGQEEGVKFLDNVAWEKVVKQAKKQNKLIFVDCYTWWCGPCKRLMSEVFPLKEVGDYMNPKFVSVKYDVEKGEGAKFKERYAGEIGAYPTLLVIDTEGNLLHKLVGYSPSAFLPDLIQRGLDGDNIYTKRKMYAQHKHDRAFVKGYLWALWNASAINEYKKVGLDYLSQYPLDSLLTKDLWNMLSYIVVSDPYSKEYAFVLDHLNQIQDLGEDRYQLESLLDSRMYEAVQRLYLYTPEQRSKMAPEEYNERLTYLRSLLKKPVKGFSVRQLELAAFECVYNDDMELLYDRMRFFMDCDMLCWSMLLEDVFRRIIYYLDDEERLQECMDYLQEKSGWMSYVVDGLQTLVNERLEQLSGGKSRKS